MYSMEIRICFNEFKKYEFINVLNFQSMFEINISIVYFVDLVSSIEMNYLVINRVYFFLVFLIVQLVLRRGIYCGNFGSNGV